MLHAIPRRLTALTTAFVLATAPLAAAGGPVMLTVTGAVANTNRGPVDAEYDKLFSFNDVTFDQAMEFDIDALAALPQTTIKTDFPKDGPMVEFSGPMLSEVLDAAGAAGTTVTVRAMDGYAIDAPFDEMIDKGAIVALARDGKPLGIGDFGPAQIVFPRADRAELADMPDDWWIWQVYHIKVE